MNDYILGDAGNDSITNSGTVTNDIDGGSEKDTLTNSGTTGNILGQAANDTITNSGCVTDTIDGGDNQDVISNTNTGSVVGVSGGVFGGDGRDSVTNAGTVTNNVEGGESGSGSGSDVWETYEREWGSTWLEAGAGAGDDPAPPGVVPNSERDGSILARALGLPNDLFARVEHAGKVGQRALQLH